MKMPPKYSRILIITLRRVGDALLTTPLVRSLRRAWPDAKIDVLVFARTAGIFEGNPDIDHIITYAGAAHTGCDTEVGLPTLETIRSSHINPERRSSDPIRPLRPDEPMSAS